MIDLQLAQDGTPADIRERPGWWGERKVDGVRGVAHDGRLLTRSGRDVTDAFPEIDVPAETVDGELVTQDMTFSTVLRRVQTEDTFKRDLLAKKAPAVFVAFDLLDDGDDLRDRPFEERALALDPTVEPYDRVTAIRTHRDTAELWEQAQADEWEGIMLKDPTAPYRDGRNEAWLKVKNWSEGTFPIVDFERTENDGFVIYVDAGAGEPQKVAVGAARDQETIRAGASEATIQFLERSDNDRLRKPSFKGAR